MPSVDNSKGIIETGITVQPNRGFSFLHKCISIGLIKILFESDTGLKVLHSVTMSTL